LITEITEVMATSNDYDELEYVWQEWHEKSGRGMRENYQTYVNLLNKAAIANEYDDNGAMWRASYEDDDLINNIQAMWEEVEDLYNQLHIYVNKKLKLIYGDKMDQDSDLIPAHLLGNMWGQSWTNLYDRVKPFDNGTLIDVTQQMSVSLQFEFSVSSSCYLEFFNCRNKTSQFSICLRCRMIL
jgi:peptidyl-dipeptidase A